MAGHNRWAFTLLSAALLPVLGPLVGQAQSTYTISNTIADTFVASGSAANPLGTNLSGLNFGAAGTLAIAPASSLKGEFDSLIKFNGSASVSQFNSVYGAGNWSVTGVALSLASNFGVQGTQPNNLMFNPINGGLFGIDWVQNSTWVEGSGSGNGTPGYPSNSAVSLQSVPGILAAGYDSLGTYTYTPPGNNVYQTYELPTDSGMLADLTTGGDVSLYFYAADNSVSYLFGSRSYSTDHPELIITAEVTPEPSVLPLMTLGFAGWREWTRRRRL